MNGIIDHPQSAFIERRQILDSILIGNECIEDKRLPSRDGLICKLNLEKDYYHVSWDFLNYILVKMGFGAKWSDVGWV